MLPYKVVHKYKNKHGRVQYQVLVFTGALDEDVERVLLKIKDKPLFDTLVDLTTKELQILDKAYGRNWYKAMFITAHIDHLFQKVLPSNETQKTQLVRKLGLEWVQARMEDQNLSSTVQSFEYRFQAKRESQNRPLTIMRGGADSSDEDENDTYQPSEEDESDDQSFPDADQDATDEEVSLEDIASIVGEQMDTEAKKVGKVIDDIIGTSNEEGVGSSMTWADNKDENLYDEMLINVFSKLYVTSLQIYYDDTIRNVKNKVCCSYMKSSAFDAASPYFIPTRLHMWSAYAYADESGKVQRRKVMLGKKWVNRTEILAVGAEPLDQLRGYEQLKGPLKVLYDNMSRYSTKITFEDEEMVVVSAYEDFMTNNEIYMVDLYHELGMGYTANEEVFKNLYNVYVRIYYPGITHDAFKQVIDYVGSNKDGKKAEANQVVLTRNTILNQQRMEGEIMTMVETLRSQPDLFEKYFQAVHVIQTVVNLMLKQQRAGEKLDLYRIFDGFIVSDKYPFVQYQAADGSLAYKFHAQDDQVDKDSINPRWFENAPYGVSFKIRTSAKGSDNKIISTVITASGKMDYKVQWKEDDQATFEDITATYEDIKQLVVKINGENDKQSFIVPDTSDFNLAFINTIQRFELPKQHIISHNDLSDFARYFYPYVAVVVDPKKRQSKVIKKNERSKYGTYLRYRRVSNFENDASIDRRIVYFIRNYDLSDKLLALEISKQFNITEKQAVERITAIQERFPRLRKTNRSLKRVDQIKTFKTPGIGVDVQGKTPDNYKIRISGARSHRQVNAIRTFMQVLVYMYIETYIVKKQAFQHIRTKLRDLTNVAKRRFMVSDVYEQPATVNKVKEITRLDKERLGFKPDKGQNQWTRACQNSGKVKRRPTPYTADTIDELTRTGYQLNPKTGDYEKSVSVRRKGKTITTVLRAAKTLDPDNNPIYYTCDPTINNEYMHVGFLTKSLNPFGHCMPCCYKKDLFSSKNRQIRDFNNRCVGKTVDGSKAQPIMAEKLYILQDTFKIPPGRYAILPILLDTFLNVSLKRAKEIQNNYLTQAPTGYFFKYGTAQDSNPFLTAVANAVELSVPELKGRLADALRNSSQPDALFASLAEGDIKTKFKTVDGYVAFITNNQDIDPGLVMDLLAVPGVVKPEGLLVVIFTDIQGGKDYIASSNHKPYNPKSDVMMLMRSEDSFFVIYQLQKAPSAKHITVTKTFSDPAVRRHITMYALQAQQLINVTLSRVERSEAMNDLLASKGITVKRQVLDQRNKVKFFVTDLGLVPVFPSGCLHDIPTAQYDVTPFVRPLNATLEMLVKLHADTGATIVPTGAHYSEDKDGMLTIVSLVIDPYVYVPVKPEALPREQAAALGESVGIERWNLELNFVNDTIDGHLTSGDVAPSDGRTAALNLHKYEVEAYQMFRLALSHFLSLNADVKQRVQRMLVASKDDYATRSAALKRVVLKACSPQLLQYAARGEQPEQQEGGTSASRHFAHISDALPNLEKYEVENKRQVCTLLNNQDVCASNPHCKHVRSECKLRLTTEQALDFTARVVVELLTNGIKSQEIMMVDDYFVTDIVNQDNFTTRKSQRILKYTGTDAQNLSIKKVMAKLFGKDSVPIIGRRRVWRGNPLTTQDLSADYPLERIKDVYFQAVLLNDTMYRAFANAYYWLKQKGNDVSARNLGYHHPTQTELANYFKSQVIDWFMDRPNRAVLIEELAALGVALDERGLQQYKESLIRSSENMLTYIIDAYILSRVTGINIGILDAFDKPLLLLGNSTTQEVYVRFNISQLDLSKRPSQVVVVHRPDGSRKK